MALPIQRLRSAWHYIGEADNPLKWRLSRADCPNCGGRFFVSLKSDAFMTRCMSCTANAVNLALIPIIKSHDAEHPIESAWEMSTYGATLEYLRRNVPRVIQSEYFPEANPGDLVDGVLNQDVQNLSFEDESLDFITASYVFEHVADDIKGYAECYRTLRRNGGFAFTVPLLAIPETKQLAKIVDGEIQHFLEEPEYHDSRLAGPNSVLTYWHHSRYDILERVSSVGFDTKLVDVLIAPSQKKPCTVVYAVKR